MGVFSILGVMVVLGMIAYLVFEVTKVLKGKWKVKQNK